MMERMMSWPIDDFLQEMTSDHIRIMDLASESKFGRMYHPRSAHEDSPQVDYDE
jgi:hypothetical protein